MIVDVAEVDRVPQALGLKLDAHDDRPIRVIGARQYRVLGTTASFSDDPLTHHHLAPMASHWTATTASWRGRGPATRGAGWRLGDARTRHGSRQGSDTNCWPLPRERRTPSVRQVFAE